MLRKSKSKEEMSKQGPGFPQSYELGWEMITYFVVMVKF